MSALLLTDVEVEGDRVDVRCVEGRIGTISAHVAAQPHDEVVSGGGGALLPGLHDHHLHLLASAAAYRSVQAGPPDVQSIGDLRHALRHADQQLGAGHWVRAVGYHESVAGELDRSQLDALLPSRPVRVQHRSGALWILNSAACRAIGVDDGATTHPMEVDDAGRATGRLFRRDAWLRARLPPEELPDLAALGRQLADRGVTGVMDATPFEDLETLRLLESSGLPQHVHAMGGLSLAHAAFGPNLSAGPVKLILADHSLPPLDEVVRWLQEAHASDRPVAVHCVTRIALVLALTAWQVAGARPGDRIEHAAVVPLELISTMAELSLTVVTQPHFLSERGDDYLRDVVPEDQPDLYRCGSLLRSGVPVGGGTDAPYGDLDPWRAVRAAVERAAPSGRVLGPDERVTPNQALALFLAPLDDPGGAPRRVEVGAPADLVLLEAPLEEMLRDPSSDLIRLTLVDGLVVGGRTSAG